MDNEERMAPIRENLAEIAAERGCLQEACGYYQANLAHFAQLGDEAAQQFFRNKLAELAEKSKP